MKPFIAFGSLVTAFALWAAGSPADSPTPAPEPPGPAADHHVHIRSAAATDVLLRIQKEVGQTVIGEEAEPATGADDVVAALDTAGIRQATLLSVAYFFGFPGIEVADEYTKVRAENDYVARQAARYPDRLTAFCGVDPLAGYALEEIDRCAREPDLEGLKLHLANSDVDLRDTADVRRLAAVFRRADEGGLPIVVHVFTRNPDYGYEDADIFIREVLGEAPDVPVQIAHLAGPSGFTAATDGASKAFADAIASGSPALGELYFDIAAVVVPPSRARGDSTVLRQIRRMNRAAVDRMREIGLDRILFGSDWFGSERDVGSMRAYIEALHSALPLDEDEVRDLLDDRASYLR